MEKIPKVSCVLRGSCCETCRNIRYDGVYQEEFFKKTLFSEPLQQLLINKSNIWWSCTRHLGFFVWSYITYTYIFRNGYIFRKHSFCRTQPGKHITFLRYIIQKSIGFHKLKRRSQLYLFFWFLNFNSLLLTRYFKVTFFVWNFSVCS